MKANNENVFLGATVKYRNENYIIVKVNTKSCYITKDKNFLKRWENNTSSKWKQFCEKYKAQMVKYDEIEIDKKEVLRKTNFIEKKKKRKYISDLDMRELQEIWNRVKKKYVNPKFGKTFKFTVETNRGGFFRAISASYPEKWILLNINNEYVFFDLLSKEWIPFNEKIHKKGKNVIFRKKPDFLEKTA